MFDFLERNIQWLVVALVAVISLFTSNSVDVGELEEYLGDLLLWTPAIVLVWFAKLEISHRRDRDEIISQIESNREKQDDVLRDLWSVVGSPVKDERFEERMKAVIRNTIQSKIHEDRIVSNAFIEALESLSDVARRLEYAVDFGALNVYPAPFYQLVDHEVMATNIGRAGSGFYGNLETSAELLVRINEDALARANGLIIRRLFIIEPDEIDEPTHDLIHLYKQVGVQVRTISEIKARTIAATRSTGEIRGLHDFSLFKGVHGRNYSGRFFDFSASHKKMLITSNDRINRALEEQFNSLWQEADEHIQGIEPSSIEQAPRLQAGSVET